MKRYIKSSMEDKLYALTERHFNSYMDTYMNGSEYDELDYGKMVDYVADMVSYNLRERYGYKDIDSQRLYKQVAMIIDELWDYYWN